jgi:hypothetical protein
MVSAILAVSHRNSPTYSMTTAPAGQHAAEPQPVLHIRSHEVQIKI